MARSSTLLATIERHHPEWLRAAGYGRGARPSTASGPIRLEMASPGRRPDVELEFDDDHALVRVGRHERLIVWKDTDGEDLALEILRYVERLLRPSASYGVGQGAWPRLTEEQRALLIAIDKKLNSRGAASDVAVNLDGLEPHAEVSLLLPPERRLAITFYVAPDTFQMSANGAVLRLARQDYGDDGPSWVSGCLETLDRLLAEDLVIRTDRNLLGRRVGAVRIPDPNGGKPKWNGDLLSYLGWGQMSEYANWWSPD